MASDDDAGSTTRRRAGKTPVARRRAKSWVSNLPCAEPGRRESGGAEDGGEVLEWLKLGRCRTLHRKLTRLLAGSAAEDTKFVEGNNCKFGERELRRGMKKEGRASR